MSELKRVNFEKLAKMNYEDGKSLLLSLGYVAEEVGETESNISDWVQDEYFRLYDDDVDFLAVISWETYGNGQDGEDSQIEIVREGWSDAIRPTLIPE